jgi:hypothetical protein
MEKPRYDPGAEVACAAAGRLLLLSFPRIGRIYAMLSHKSFLVSYIAASQTRTCAFSCWGMAVTNGGCGLGFCSVAQRQQRPFFRFV